MTDDRPIQPNEVLVEGRYYDTTGFKHPGGSIVKFNQGKGDATEAFVEFHMHSKKAYKMLHALPSRPATIPAEPSKEAVRHMKMSREYAAWRAQLLKDGWFDPDYVHITYRISELIVLYVLGAYIALNTPFWLIGMVILGIVEGRCGWCMHEGGHNSLTGIIWLDHRLQEFMYGLGCGMSAAWWRIQHNKHHATPQKLKHDADLDTLPLVAFNKAISKMVKNPIGKLWIKLQCLMFTPVTCSLVALFWQAFLHPRHIIRTKRPAEAFWIGLRLTLWIYFTLFVAKLSVPQAIGAYFLHQFFGAAYIFTNFALSHSHLPVLDADKDIHWLEFASNHTINITPHWFTNWWMGYLNYQIEHHLFPEMPQYRFVKLHTQTRELFQKLGLTYDCRDYFVACGDTYRNLYEVGN